MPTDLFFVLPATHFRGVVLDKRGNTFRSEVLASFIANTLLISTQDMKSHSFCFSLFHYCFSIFALRSKHTVPKQAIERLSVRECCYIGVADTILVIRNILTVLFSFQATNFPANTWVITCCNLFD